MAVTLVTAVFTTAVYLHPSRIPDELFNRLWPWRAHVWNRYGGTVIWCINEASKTDGPFTCRIGFLTDGPDCPRPDTQDVTAAHAGRHRRIPLSALGEMADRPRAALGRRWSTGLDPVKRGRRTLAPRAPPNCLTIMPNFYRKYPS